MNKIDYYAGIPPSHTKPTTVFRFFKEDDKSPERYDKSKRWVEDSRLWELFATGELTDDEHISEEEALRIISELDGSANYSGSSMHSSPLMLSACNNLADLEDHLSPTGLSYVLFLEQGFMDEQDLLSTLRSGEPDRVIVVEGLKTGERIEGLASTIGVPMIVSFFGISPIAIADISELDAFLSETLPAAKMFRDAWAD